MESGQGGNVRISSGAADNHPGYPHSGAVTARGRTRKQAPLALLVLILIAACGGAPSTVPSAPVGSSALQTEIPGPNDAVSVGPVTVDLPVIDAATDVNLSLAISEADDRARARDQAGFPREVGPGWGALSKSADDAIDAAALAVAAEFVIDIPTTSLDAQFASVVMPDRFDVSPPASAASALAIVTAALTAGKQLGKGGTIHASNTQTRTSTAGNDVATVTVKMTGSVTSTGSRVVGEFTFDLTGSVSNSVSGATAQMTGTAAASVEIDGCPDASGSSKGKVSLSASERVSGQHDGGEGSASWTRDLTGDFDISVDDEANISGLTIDTQANETVVESTREPGEDDPETDGHELGVTLHGEYASGAGFAGTVADASKTDGDITHQKDATKAHLASLVKSAIYAIMVAAVGLGQDAEPFWRGGKCVDIAVDPSGGDVEADSAADVTATVKHRFEGDELEVPVEASLAGVAAVEPAGERQDAPATVTYTAGSADGEVGEVTFKTVSNRGIAEETVKFTVVSKMLTVGLSGTMTTSLAGIAYSTTLSAPDIVLRLQPDGTYAGEGPAAASVRFQIADCPNPFNQTGTLRVVAIREVVEEPALPRNWILTWDSSSQFTTTGSCLGIDLGSFTGPEGAAAGFLFILGDVVVPPDGGTQDIHLSKPTGPASNVLDATVTVEIIEGVTP